MIKRLLQVEGFINYTPSKIEITIENALAKHGFKLSNAKHYEDYYAGLGMGCGIFTREIEKLTKPFKFEYERYIRLSDKEIQNGRKGLQSKSIHEMLKCPVNDIEKHLVLRKKHYDSIKLQICNEDDIYFLFDKEKILDSTSFIEPRYQTFLKRAFRNYTVVMFPSVKEFDLVQSHDFFTKILLDNFKSFYSQNRSRVERQVSTHVINMIIDEFARVINNKIKR